MAEYPVMPLYTDAYLSDTLHLTTLQHGAYCLLLMVAWRTPDCALPNDDKVLARYARLDVRTWLKNRDTVMQFWELGGDHKWRQKRQLDTRISVEYRRSLNSEAGKASALKRKNRGSTSVGTKSKPKSNLLNLNHELDIGKEVSKPPLPPFIPAGDWEAFEEMRDRIKKPMTERAKELIVMELEKLRAAGNDPGAVLRQSVRNNWLDVFALRDKTPGAQHRHGRFEQQDYSKDTGGFDVTNATKKNG